MVKKEEEETIMPNVIPREQGSGHTSGSGGSHGGGGAGRGGEGSNTKTHDKGSQVKNPPPKNGGKGRG